MTDNVTADADIINCDDTDMEERKGFNSYHPNQSNNHSDDDSYNECVQRFQDLVVGQGGSLLPFTTGDGKQNYESKVLADATNIVNAYTSKSNMHAFDVLNDSTDHCKTMALQEQWVDPSLSKLDKKHDKTGYEVSLASSKCDEMLAIAVPVAENDTDKDTDSKCLPAAIELDPDQKMSEYESKKQLRQKRLLVLCVIVPAILFISIGIGIYCGLSNHMDNNTDSDLFSLNEKRVQSIRDMVSKHIPDSMELDDQYSPYSRALYWITFVDPLRLAPDASSNFLQRYILAHLYYLTSTNSPNGRWQYCSPTQLLSPNETSTGSSNNYGTNPDTCRETVWSWAIGLSYTEGENSWLTELNECDWAGITCDVLGQVTEINIGTLSHLK